MKIKAVSPYIYPNQLNFKDKPFNAWKSQYPDAIVNGFYPKFLHRLLFEFDLFPSLYSKVESRLIFVQPVSLYFDANISVLTNEVVPFIWDCWPCFYDKMTKWLKRHKVRTAIFTSRQEMEAMKRKCPHINMLWCPEAVDAGRYKEGKMLKDRTIDLLEFGRASGIFGMIKSAQVYENECIEVLEPNSSSIVNPMNNINHICTKVNESFIFSDEELYSAMGNAKVTICLPRSITHPDEAQGIETLTQRYWECMLSRIVMVGHAPEELIDIIGYNPCVEISDKLSDVSMQIIDVINHIDDYQELVNKNRDVALEKGDWKDRMESVSVFLSNCGYRI